MQVCLWQKVKSKFIDISVLIVKLTRVRFASCTSTNNIIISSEKGWNWSRISTHKNVSAHFYLNTTFYRTVWHAQGKNKFDTYHSSEQIIKLDLFMGIWKLHAKYYNKIKKMQTNAPPSPIGLTFKMFENRWGKWSRNLK